MVCSNCPQRAVCETPCDLLINDLEASQDQAPEVLLTPYQFDQFVDRFALEDHLEIPAENSRAPGFIKSGDFVEKT